MRHIRYWSVSAAIFAAAMLAFGIASDWWNGLPFLDAAGFRMGLASAAFALFVMVPIGFIVAGLAYLRGRGYRDPPASAGRLPTRPR